MRRLLYNQFIPSINTYFMIRRMKIRRMKTKQIESQVTRIGNGAHVLVPKDWLGKEVIVKIKEK
jgi:putative transposon-encoded protein